MKALMMVALIIGSFAGLEAQAMTCKKREARPQQHCGGSNSREISVIGGRYREKTDYGGCYPVIWDQFGTAKILKSEDGVVTYHLVQTGYFIGDVPFELERTEKRDEKVVTINNNLRTMRVIEKHPDNEINFPVDLVCD